MYGEEIKDIILAYTESGLPDCVWAAVVPNNIDRVLGDLVEEVNEEQVLMEAQLAVKRAADLEDV